jgi:hypothetical protein
LEKIAAVYANPAVQEMTVANKKEADRLEREGLDNAQRKSYRADAAQAASQQASSPSSYTRP